MRPLLALRYRLLWAQVRTRNGKIVLFLTGYLLLVFLIALLGLGGFGAALASIRSGHAELVARIVLGGFFLNALTAAVLLGLGMSPAFSDAALRRYPLSALQRLAARQLTAFLEPLWMCVLALDLGIAFGFYVFGAASFWLAVLAALLLVAANYLLARLLLSAIERLSALRGGPFVLLVLLMVVSFGPALIAPRFADRSFADAALALLQLTPPFAVARVMAGVAPLGALFSLLAWGLGLAAALALLERLPIPSQAVAKARAGWDGPCDRLAALFGPASAPLIAKSLRYYLRNTKVRFNLLLTIPILAALVITQSRQQGPQTAFLWAVSLISMVGCLSVGQISVNAFGLDGSGFRRYFLLPISPYQAVMAPSVVAVLLGATLIPVAVLAWLLWAPVPTDDRMLALLVSSALAGLFFFHGLGVWTSLLAPRRMPFAALWGNQLSIAANVLLIGGIVFAGVLSQVLRLLVGLDPLLRHWWVAPPLVPLGLAFYLFTLRRAGGVLQARRERILAAVEGRG